MVNRTKLPSTCKISRDLGRGDRHSVRHDLGRNTGLAKSAQSLRLALLHDRGNIYIFLVSMELSVIALGQMWESFKSI
jgi:hypothetical protein